MNKTNFHYGSTVDGTVLSIDVAQALATKDFAIVELECLVGGDVFLRAVGSSRRFLGDDTLKADKPNRDVGVGLAAARALAQISKKLERQALGLNKHDEQMRQEKKRIPLAEAERRIKERLGKPKGPKWTKKNRSKKKK